jgi:hypothetical protein
MTATRTAAAVLIARTNTVAARIGTILAGLGRLAGHRGIASLDGRTRRDIGLAANGAVDSRDSLLAFELRNRDSVAHARLYI